LTTLPTPKQTPEPDSSRAVGETLPALFAELSLARRSEPPGFDLSTLTDIQWRGDRCTGQSLLCFQRFDDGRGDAELLQRYLAGGRFGALITNQPLEGLEQFGDKAVYVTAPGAWGATLERLCDRFYPLTPGHWRLAGVTGTNGKTTTVKYLESMLVAAGQRVLSIGTLGLALNGEPLGETGFTSPPYIELRRMLHAYQARADVLVMEVSSHALHQGRVHGLRFDAAAWTNFSQDHLDYHGDEQRYFDAKAGILELLAEGTPLLTTSADVAERLRMRFGDGTTIRLFDPVALADDVLRERPFLALEYNRANYRLALEMARTLLGSEPQHPWRALSAVDGRFECYVHGQRRIVIDFAHTPDALDNVLAAIRAAFPSARILTLFGCGGDRDRTKRPLMGAAVCRGSDRVILTSDNPRFEDPRAIIDDTLAGMADCPVPPEIILDRADAIRRLFDWLAAQPEQDSWVALIAGKGHERYIDQQGHKRYFSDQDEVERNLRRLRWTA
jgi:UDP-N-acetylmuramoyl-L-alanyl-D-glutamate--2,6-diaminopimelate ligase